MLQILFPYLFILADISVFRSQSFFAQAFPNAKKKDFRSSRAAILQKFKFSVKN